MKPTRRRQLENLLIEQEMRRCQRDFKYFLTTYVHIEDKTSRTGYSLFNLLPHQVETVDALLTKRRILVLKARQLGLTTTVMAYVLWLSLFQPGFSALVLSHKDDYAKSNISRLRLMYSLLPSWMRARLPVPNQASNSFVLDFKHGQTSTVLSMPATAKVGASMTLDFIFLDEFGLMEYQDEAYDTLVPTIDAASKSPRAGAVLVIASTARGPANNFARKWRNPGSLFRLFFPWSCSPTFTADDYERERADYEAQGEPWRIYQERPSTAEEAFRKSGAAFFNQLPPLEECEPFPDHLRGRLTETDTGVEFVPDPFGPLHLAEPAPDRFAYYVLAVDPAHGVENDSTVGVVLTFDEDGDPYVAAYWASNSVGQADAAEQLYLLGHWFKGREQAALLAVETTGGHAELMLHVWRERGYPNLYTYLSASARKRRLAPTIGINTSGVSGKRSLVLAKAAEMLPITGNIYPELREELGTFVRRDGSGKVAADVGCHDDHVLATAIGLWVLSEKGSAPTVPTGVEPSPVFTMSVLPEINRQVEKERKRQAEENRRWETAVNRRARRLNRGVSSGWR